MLLILRSGEILLEKRPPTGVWGGLWCLPEMSLSDDVRALCHRRFGASLARVERLPLLRHGFTHFTLEVAPVVCHLETATVCAAEPGQVWLPLEEAPRAAVPAPLRKLLLALKTA